MKTTTENDNTQYKKWLVACAVGTGVFLCTLDSSIVNVSLPTMVDSLHTNFTIIQWVVLAYLLTITTLILGFGRLGDILGKKRIYMTGFSLFTFSSLMCGLSPHVYMLIFFRILQGIGGAMTMSMGPAIMTEAFPPNERGKAMGIIGAVVSIGIVTGPALGGIIVHLLSWHWIFFVNVPCGIIGLFLVFRFIPHIRPEQRQRFDALGAVLLFITLICFLIGLSIGQRQGINTEVILLMVASLFALSIFIWVEKKVSSPMIMLSLFKNPILCVNLFTGFMVYASMGGIFLLLPFYLESILGFSTMKVGLLMCASPVMMGIFAPIAGNLSDRLGSRPITLAGLAALFIGYALATTLDAQTGALGFMSCTFFIGIGAGLFTSPNNSAIMGAGPRNQLGLVSGLMAISRTLGQTVGVAIIGSLWAIRIHMLLGNSHLANTTQAPVGIQIAGLSFVFIVVALAMIVCALISIYGYVLERRQRTPHPNMG